MSSISRILDPISTDELERRWKATRAMMDEHGIDALVLQNSNDWLGGYVMWFTDTPANFGYPRSVLFPRNELMTIVEQGPFGAVRRLDGGDPANRGVAEILCNPSYSSISYTSRYDAELVVGAIKRAGYRTVGLVGTAGMYHDFCAHLKDALSSVRLVDATDMIDRIKAIKSNEEIALIRRTAQMQDQVVKALAEHIRPGMKDFEIAAYAQYVGQTLGSEQGIFIGSSAAVSGDATFRHRRAQGREIRPGDCFTLLVENNGPGCFYTELARTFVLGRAPTELVEAVGILVEAQNNTLKLLKPGASGGDVLESHNAFMRAHGLAEERRLFCHGQGYDMVERPLLRDDEQMPLAAGMNIVLHPDFHTDRVFTSVCDNYVIGREGPGECLHRTPKTVIEI